MESLWNQIFNFEFFMILLTVGIGVHYFVFACHIRHITFILGRFKY